jgi:hypothetical protein
VEWRSEQPSAWIKGRIEEVIGRLRVSGTLTAIGYYFGPAQYRGQRGVRAWIVADTALFTLAYEPGEVRPEESESGEPVPAWSLTCEL